MIWDTVIGLEVHAQLKTKSKLFSGAATQFGASPNTHTSLIDAGLPGVLPVLNQHAVRLAILFGLAINARINNLSYFERKNYFYPDLPKGYQISQFQQPILSEGHLTIENNSGQLKTVTIARAHLEEDAGRSIHDKYPDLTGVDLNRAGTPLLEIVTTPCLSGAEEAISYLKALHQLVRFLGICDGNMQEGSFRCDVNISLKPAGSEQLGTRVELKNLNSFRFIEKAILFEQHRQQELLETQQAVLQETRSFCPNSETTQALRSKENDFDYRYFPDPDLLPIEVTSKDIATIKSLMPPLPWEIREKLSKEDRFLSEDIQFLLANPSTYQFFTAVSSQSEADSKLIINWLKTTYAATLNDLGLTFDTPPVSAELLAELLTLIKQQTISNAIAKQIFSRLVAGEKSIATIIDREGYKQTANSEELINLVQTLIKEYPQQAEDYRAGKEKLLAFFVGQVMKQTRGKANPEQVSSLLKQYLV